MSLLFDQLGSSPLLASFRMTFNYVIDKKLWQTNKWGMFLSLSLLNCSFLIVKVCVRKKKGCLNGVFSMRFLAVSYTHLTLPTKRIV